jgi:iron-sulfur cluster assembly protein
MSESAAIKINAIMAKQGKVQFLRVAVDGGGCSGFQYNFDFADAPNEDDLILERDGARILIDEISQEFLKDSEIDYVNELIGAAFKIHNPNAKSSCGCGTSFSL